MPSVIYRPSPSFALRGRNTQCAWTRPGHPPLWPASIKTFAKGPGRKCRQSCGLTRKAAHKSLNIDKWSRGQVRLLGHAWLACEYGRQPCIRCSVRPGGLNSTDCLPMTADASRLRHFCPHGGTAWLSGIQPLPMGHGESRPAPREALWPGTLCSKGTRAAQLRLLDPRWLGTDSERPHRLLFCGSNADFFLCQQKETKEHAWGGGGCLSRPLRGNAASPRPSNQEKIVPKARAQLDYCNSLFADLALSLI